MANIKIFLYCPLDKGHTYILKLFLSRPFKKGYTIVLSTVIERIHCCRLDHWRKATRIYYFMSLIGSLEYYSSFFITCIFQHFVVGSLCLLMALFVDIKV